MVLGIDLGSRSVKIVQMEGDKMMSHSLYDTIAFYRRYSRGKGELVVDFDELGFGPDERIVATGYGKMTVKVSGAAQIPEIQAHVLGAVWQSGRRDFTLLDVGGQDTKVVQVRGGRAVDFLTNDRCAASSGRYLEQMAAVLGISLDELSSCSDDPVPLSATCAIFGETELIARIVEGHPTEHLAAGVNMALFRRIAPMLKKLPSEVIIMTGGGAYNTALGKMVEAESGCRVMRVPHPQLNGAIGCCCFGGGLV